MKRLLGCGVASMLLWIGCADADPMFSTQIKLLDEKASLCMVELSKTGKDGRFCQDFSQYADYVFKGSASSYMEYHLSNGDIRKNNADYVISVLRKVRDTTSRLVGAS